MLRERGDLEVLTEPFSRAYYDGPDRVSDRFGDVEPDPAASYEAVLSEVLRPRARRVAVKDMAHQLGPLLRPDVLGRFDVSFLTRDPARTLPSFARGWPDFTDDEAGFAAQRRAFDLVAAATDGLPPVIDATGLRADPEGVVRAWCQRVGLVHRAAAMTWDAVPIVGWSRWPDWFERAQSSTGFAPPEVDDPVVPAELRDRVARCAVDHLHLVQHRLRP